MNVTYEVAREVYLTHHIQKFIEYKYKHCKGYNEAVFPDNAVQGMIRFISLNYDDEDVLFDLMEDALDDVLKDFNSNDFFVVNR